MTLIRHGPPDLHPRRPGRKLPIKVRAGSALDCYCGWGPDCELFRKMTVAQRVDCTRDKRYVAQQMWKTGMV